MSDIDQMIADSMREVRQMPAAPQRVAAGYDQLPPEAQQQLVRTVTASRGGNARDLSTIQQMFAANPAFADQQMKRYARELGMQTVDPSTQGDVVQRDGLDLDRVAAADVQRRQPTQQSAQPAGGNRQTNVNAATGAKGNQQSSQGFDEAGFTTPDAATAPPQANSIDAMIAAMIAGGATGAGYTAAKAMQKRNVLLDAQQAAKEMNIQPPQNEVDKMVTPPDEKAEPKKAKSKAKVKQRWEQTDEEIGINEPKQKGKVKAKPPKVKVQVN